MGHAFSFLPRGFASLVDYISPAAFDVVDWKGALRRSAGMTKELVLGRGVPVVERQLEPFLPPGVAFRGMPGVDDPRQNPPSSWEDPGSRVLQLYFIQLRRQGPLFLDLRHERFEEQPNGGLLWAPNGLWTALTEPFAAAVVDLYQGFYGDDGALLVDALGRLGLWPHSLAPEGRTQLLGLLEDHFGQGRSHPMAFEVRHFVGSFDALFVFLRDQRIRVSEEFLFLGLMILTLYLHLEKRGGIYDVARSYRLASNTPESAGHASEQN